MAHTKPRPAGPAVIERAGAASPVDDEEQVLEQVAARDTVRRPEEVAAYLRTFPQLVPLLIEAAEVVPRYFEPDAPLVLEVVTDPEADDPVPQLFALIETRLDPEVAADRLDRLDEDWWLDRSPPGPGVLVLDVEFV